MHLIPRRDWRKFRKILLTDTRPQLINIGEDDEIRISGVSFTKADMMFLIELSKSVNDMKGGRASESYRISIETGRDFNSILFSETNIYRWNGGLHI